jgi:hypothetical protein
MLKRFGSMAETLSQGRGAVTNAGPAELRTVWSSEYGFGN